jgi:hypothetical protein
MYASWSCPQQGGFMSKFYLYVVLRIVRRKKKIVRMERAFGRHINCSLVHLGLYKSKKGSLVSRYEDFK